MESFHIKRYEFGDKTYAQKGFRSFLYRHIDSGFRTKWCGFWTPPIKILDYYAYNVNGEWLDLSNQARFSLDKEKAIHRYNLKKQGLEISETVSVPLDRKTMISVLEIKNISPKEKKINLLVEAAINIRTKNENWHMRGYDVNYSHVRKAIDIKSDDITGYARIGIGKTDGTSIDFSGEGEYKDHYPGEKQRCFIPGIIKIKTTVKPGKKRDIPILFSGSDISKADLSENYDDSVNNWKDMIEDKKMLLSKLFSTERIETPYPKMDNAFSWSAVNLISLIHNSAEDFGIFAGIPWFLRFWARDSQWSIFGLVDIGEFDAAKMCLKEMARRYDKKIATVTDTEGKCEYYSDDTDPLFLLALDYYVRTSGDFDFEKEMKGLADRIVKNLRTDNENLVITENNGSWMDSFERDGTQIEIQSIWAEALKVYDRKKSDVLVKALDNHFWNSHENFPKDTSTDESMTANCAVPVMFGHFPMSRSVITLNRIEEEFKTAYGVRTRSPFSEGYGPSEYHKGASWGLSTGWVAAASFRQGLDNEGIEYLNSMAEEVENNQVSAMAECVDADTGKLLGATMQAWSHSMYIHAIDRYMFGVDANLRDNVITFRPNVPSLWKSAARFGKKIGYYSVNLRLDRSDDKIEMQMLFTCNPKIRGVVEMPFGVKKIVVNGKTFNDRKAEFILKKENVVVGEF
ncbi:MAG: amylo-alpha-1,6-glucosidase [archaeon]|nr:amylo-alpha-1,6-glucosidase [archaeon]